ncbi:hypothetical protein EWB00_008477 [Schistosoma japonicum]|uniref:Uncharacterized protein n=1 Tax=Schistosoma japonicum TaxID=6182 RepID=A0A4Z2CPZ4_SCHJA|nr:hypothetical protein EWB00_008477 [Schistosoma japonicum]
MDQDQFKFNFPIDQVLEEWKTDENENLPTTDEEDDNELSVVDHVSFFTPHYKEGIEYFTINNPEKVKKEWIEARKSIIPHIKNSVRHLVRDKFRKLTIHASFRLRVSQLRNTGDFYIKQDSKESTEVYDGASDVQNSDESSTIELLGSQKAWLSFRALSLNITCIV